MTVDTRIELARNSAAWLNERCSGDALFPPRLLIELADFGISVEFSRRCMRGGDLDDHRVQLPGTTARARSACGPWDDLFTTMRKRGVGFVVVGPDHEGPNVEGGHPNREQEEDDGEELAPYIISVDRPSSTVMPYLLADPAGDRFFVGDDSVAYGLLMLLVDEDPGRDKMLRENRYAFRLAAIQQVAANQPDS